MYINRLYELLAGLLPVRKINQIAKRRAPSVGVLERLEDRVVLTVDVWTGASSNLWSDNGNWQDNSAPTAGEDLVFPSSATNKTAVYDSGLGVSNFGSITIQDSGYDISSSFASSLTLTAGISTSYGSSISNFDISFDPGNGTVSVGAGGTLELGGTIGGTSGLAVSGGGTLQLAGAASNTYTGTTTVASATTLVLDKTSATAIPGDLTISGGGTVRLTQSDQIADTTNVAIGTLASLNLNNFNDTIQTLTLTAASVSTGTGTLTLGGDVTTVASSTTSFIGGNLDLGGATRTFIVADGAAGTDLIVTANVSGTGAGLIKGGAGSAMGMSGNNTYDGVTTINTGGIIISNANALGTTSAGTIVNPGALLGFQGSVTFAAEPMTISGNGVGSLGALWSSSGSNTVTGPITLAAASYIGAESSAPMTISGQITDGASTFALTKVRSGSVTLTGANSYDGVTTVSAGTLILGNDAALGTGNATVSASTSLKLSGGITVANNITISGVGVSSGGALSNVSGDNTLSGAITLAANSNIGSTSGNLTLSGAVSDGASSFALTKVQSGTVTLSNANSYDGGTTISGGVLAISNGSALGTGSVAISNGAELDLSNDITLSRNISFVGSGVGGNGSLRSVSGNNVYSGTATVLGNDTRIKVDAGQLEFSGDLTDGNNSYGVDKYGSGVMLVSGSLTSTLVLHAVEGDVRINGSDSSVVTLYGGTVSGTGTIGTLNHAGGSRGSINPGTGGSTTGTLTTTSGFQIGATGITHIDIGGTTAGSNYDQIVNTTSGNVDISDSNIEVALVNGFTPAVGDVFKVIDMQNNGSITGTFSNLAEGDKFTSGIVTYQVSYVGGDGNDVTLTVVAVTYTWTGLGGDNNWSTGANWSGDVAPSGGEDLVFPAGAARKTNSNNFAVDTAFNSITFAASGYNILGNRIELANGIKGTLTSGNSNFSPNVVLIGSGSFDVVAGGRVSMGSTISGNYGFTKTGPGELVLFNFSNDTYTGATTIDAGTVYLNAQGGAIAVPHSLVIGDLGGTVATVQLARGDQIADGASVTVYDGATFDVSGASDLIDSLTLQGGSVTVGSGGILGIGSGISSNATALHTTATISGAGTLALSNAFGTLLPITVAQDVNANVDLRIGTAITGNNRGIQKLGDGTLALSGTGSTYDNNTNAEGGILQIETDSALGNTNTVVVATGGSVDFVGANLSIDRGFSIANGAGFNGGNAIGVLSGSTTLSGPIGLFANAQIGAANDSTLTINGTIFEDIDPPYFNITVNNQTNGRTILGGDNSNSFQGDIDVVSGFLRVANGAALGQSGVSTTVTVEFGATLELSGGITIPSTKTIAISGVPVANYSKIMSLSGDNTILGDIPITGGNNESFDVAGGTTLTVSGVISGARDFDKNNSGTLILTGINTHTGNVNVGDGKLLVNGSLATSNLVFVDGTLGGSGTVSDVTISAIGTLAPGNSPGILSTGALTFQGGSAYSVELNGATAGTEYDQTSVEGTVDLGNTTLAVSLGYQPAVGTVFTIIDNDGSDAIIGAFNGFAEGSTFVIGNSTFQISYVGGSGNDVTLTLLSRTDTWTGLGGDNNWSTAANWMAGVAPQPGDDLIFPVGAARLQNVNDLASGTPFKSITLESAGYDISGNRIILTDGFASTYSAGNSTFELDTTLTGTETFDIASGGTLDMSGSISVVNFQGGYGVTKTGGGTLRYSGFTANFYNGTTTINAGTLQLAKADNVIAANGSVIVGNNTVGATLDVAGSNQFWVGADVTVNEGSTFDVNSHVEFISNLNLQGSTVQIDAGGVLELYVGITTYATTNNVTSVIQGLGALGIDNWSNTFRIADDTDLAIDLRISAVVESSHPANGFFKEGAGTLALSGSNTFSGNAVVDSGVVQVESDTALGDSSGVTIVNAGASVVFVGGTRELAENFTIAGAGNGALGALYVLSGSTTLANNVSLSDNSQIGASDGSTLTLDGGIIGSTSHVAIVQGVNSGTTILNGTSDYSGGTTIASGTVIISNPAAFGSGAVTVGDGTANSGHLVLALTGLNVVNNAFIFDAPITTALQVNSGATILNGGVTLDESLGIDEASGASLEFAGPINDGGHARSLTKGGPGTLIFSGVNTYTGTTFVDQGLLQLNSGATSVQGNITISGPGTAATVQELRGHQIADGATVNLANAGATLDLNNFDDVIGALSLTGSTVTTGTGLLTLASGGSITTLASSQTATISGNLGFAGPNNFFNVAQGITLSGVDLAVSAMVSSYANIIKDGAGTMAMSAANTYAGGTNINAGVLAISHNAGAGSGVVNILGTGTFDVSGGITVSNPLNVYSGGTAIRSSSGTNALDGSFNMGTDTTIDVSAASTLMIASTIDDSSNGKSLTKTGPGTLVLSSSNTYSGDTTAASGFLFATDSDAFGTAAVSSGVTIQSGATLEVSGGITIPSTKTINISGVPVSNFSKIMSLSGNNTIQGDITITGGNNVAFDVVGGTTLTVSGNISGSRDFDKNGTGVLIITGTNSNTGNVNVGDGGLRVDGALGTSNSLFVDGVVSGTGTLPNVTVSSIGTLSPGNSTGIIHSGDLTFSDSGSTYFVQLNGATAGTGYDQIDVTGTVTLAGATLSVSLGYTPASGDSYVIINNDGNDPVNGTFNGLPEGAYLAVGGQQFKISYAGGLNGNDVVLYANNAPTAIQLGNHTVVENATIGTVVGGFTTTDADTGDSFTYTLVVGAGDDDNAAFGIDGSGNLVTAAVVDYENQTSYSIRVRSTDAGGLFTEQTFEITVTPVNDNAPIFSSSATFTVPENMTAVGTVIATDADLPGQTVTYSITGGDDATLFSIDSATGVLKFITAPNYEVPTDAGGNNVYNVSVTANDNSGSTTEQNIAVTVTPVNDNAPLFSSSATFNVPENTTAVGTVIATDADLPGQTVTYSITGGDDATLFSIDSGTGVLTFITAPNYEVPTDAGGNNVYNVDVTANDNSGLTTVQNIAVTVTPVNDNAPVFSSSPTFNVPENTTAVGTVIATDADLPGQTVTYSITGGDDATLFNIDSATGVLTFVSAPNYEVPTDAGGNNVYNVSVTANDNSGSTTVQNIAVTVTPVNDNAPLFSSSATFTVPENTTTVCTVIATDADLPGQTVTYSITGGDDATLFNIDSATGVLTFITAPNYEVPTDAGGNNVYNVSVTANDNSGSTTVQNIAVTVTPVNDNAPVFSSSASFNVPENTTAVGTVIATDADLPGQTVTYSITGGADSTLFSIDSATGVLTFNTAPNYEVPTDAGGNNVYNVEVTANDNSGSTTVQNIAVTVTPVNDNAPVFTSSASVNVAENTTVVTTVVATDADLPAQQVTYSITGGVDRSLFTINPNTGVLSFLSPPDYEHPADVGGNNSYEVQITANDGVGMSTAQDLIVNVTNVVEAPVITLNPDDASYLLGKENAYIDPIANYQADVTETDYSAAQLTVAITVNRQPKDILSINPQGNKPGQINLKGKNVLYGGVVIGTFQGGTRANPSLVITFNSAASEGAVQALVKRITFYAKNERHASHLSRTVQMQVTNVSGHDSNQATRIINIVGAM